MASTGAYFLASQMIPLPSICRLALPIAKGSARRNRKKGNRGLQEADKAANEG
jgi:hypothetical protein